MATLTVVKHVGTSLTHTHTRSCRERFFEVLDPDKANSLLGSDVVAATVSAGASILDAAPKSADSDAVDAVPASADSSAQVDPLAAPLVEGPSDGGYAPADDEAAEGKEDPVGALPSAVKPTNNIFAKTAMNESLHVYVHLALRLPSQHLNCCGLL